MRIRKPKPVAEYEATGELERVYHEIRQIQGVNLNFRTWGGYGKFLPVMWDATRANLETRVFENAADQVRAEAVRIAGQLGRLDIKARSPLGESQSYQIQKALALYHYINPKLLVLTSAVRLALIGEELRGGAAQSDVELIERGVPAGMYPMEMVSEKPDDELVKKIFAEIKRTLSLQSINSDYRTLALWPDYLAAAWSGLKPIVQREEYSTVSAELRETARKLALSLPYAIDLSMEKVKEIGEGEEVFEKTESFEKLLPGLIINIALLELDWDSAEALSRSPFPAERREYRR
ncbi:MAG: halocarboxylic acid dehydrogenase DehI family protein [Candidatus Binatia bacterium]